MRPLTENQFRRLLALGSGGMIVSGGNRRDWRGMLARGFVVGELGGQGCYVNGVTITPDGYRALADALDRYGWRCLRCNGTGTVDDDRCARCNGSGRTHWSDR